MGWEAPIKTDISVAVMEATLQKKENKHNVVSDHQTKH